MPPAAFYLAARLHGVSRADIEGTELQFEVTAEYPAMCRRRESACHLGDAGAYCSARFFFAIHATRGRSCVSPDVAAGRDCAAPAGAPMPLRRLFTAPTDDAACWRSAASA